MVFAVVLGYPTELDGKSLCLTTPYSLVRDHGEIKFIQTRKLSSFLDCRHRNIQLIKVQRISVECSVRNATSHLPSPKAEKQVAKRREGGIIIRTRKHVGLE